MTNQERYVKKLAVYNQALNKVGYSKIEDKIGKLAASKLDMANDAFKRKQAEVIIATFLSEAQEYGEAFCGIQTDEGDLYTVLKYNV